MEISDRQTFANLKTLFEEDFGVLITDTNDNPVFAYLAGQGEQIAAVSKKEVLRSGRCGVKEDRIGVCEWGILLYRPVGAVSAAAKGITVLVLLVIIICMVPDSYTHLDVYKRQFLHFQ